jgi:hypothetical protein
MRLLIEEANMLENFIDENTDATFDFMTTDFLRVKMNKVVRFLAGMLVSGPPVDSETFDNWSRVSGSRRYSRHWISDVGVQ